MWKAWCPTCLNRELGDGNPNKREASASRQVREPFIHAVAFELGHDECRGFGYVERGKGSQLGRQSYLGNGEAVQVDKVRVGVWRVPGWGAGELGRRDGPGCQPSEFRDIVASCRSVARGDSRECWGLRQTSWLCCVKTSIGAGKTERRTGHKLWSVWALSCR